MGGDGHDAFMYDWLQFKANKRYGAEEEQKKFVTFKNNWETIR